MEAKTLISRLAVLNDHQMCNIKINDFTFQCPLTNAICLSSRINESYAADSLTRDFQFEVDVKNQESYQCLQQFMIQGNMEKDDDLPILLDLYNIGLSLGINELGEKYARKCTNLSLTVDDILDNYQYFVLAKDIEKANAFISANIEKFPQTNLISFFKYFGFDTAERILFHPDAVYKDNNYLVTFLIQLCREESLFIRLFQNVSISHIDIFAVKDLMVYFEDLLNLFNEPVLNLLWNLINKRLSITQKAPFGSWKQQTNQYGAPTTFPSSIKFNKKDEPQTSQYKPVDKPPPKTSVIYSAYPQNDPSQSQPSDSSGAPKLEYNPQGLKQWQNIPDDELSNQDLLIKNAMLARAKQQAFDQSQNTNTRPQTNTNTSTKSPPSVSLRDTTANQQQKFVPMSYAYFPASQAFGGTTTTTQPPTKSSQGSRFNAPQPPYKYGSGFGTTTTTATTTQQPPTKFGTGFGKTTTTTADTTEPTSKFYIYGYDNVTSKPIFGTYIPNRQNKTQTDSSSNNPKTENLSGSQKAPSATQSDQPSGTQKNNDAGKQPIGMQIPKGTQLSSVSATNFVQSIAPFINSQQSNSNVFQDVKSKSNDDSQISNKMMQYYKGEEEDDDDEEEEKKEDKKD